MSLIFFCCIVKIFDFSYTTKRGNTPDVYSPYFNLQHGMTYYSHQPQAKHLTTWYDLLLAPTTSENIYYIYIYYIYHLSQSQCFLIINIRYCMHISTKYYIFIFSTKKGHPYWAKLCK